MIDRLAGGIGIDPENWTLRRLMTAWEFRTQQDWRHTAMVCAVVEAFAGMGGRRHVSPDKYNLASPGHQSTPGVKMYAERIGMAANAFCGKDAPEYVIDSKTGIQTRVK